MARTVVYDRPAVQEAYVRATEGRRQRHKAATQQRKNAEASARGASANTTARSDDYLSKIAKYVPAEMIAIVTLFFGTWVVKGNWVWLWIGVGAALNVVYLFITALQQSGKVPPPRMYFYGLSAAAFVGWAIATVPAARGAAHLGGDDKKAGFVLALTAFVIPLLDTGFSYFQVQRREEQPAVVPGAG